MDAKWKNKRNQSASIYQLVYIFTYFYRRRRVAAFRSQISELVLLIARRLFRNISFFHGAILSLSFSVSLSLLPLARLRIPCSAADKSTDTLRIRFKLMTKTRNGNIFSFVLTCTIFYICEWFWWMQFAVSTLHAVRLVLLRRYFTRLRCCVICKEIGMDGLICPPSPHRSMSLSWKSCYSMTCIHHTR